MMALTSSSHTPTISKALIGSLILTLLSIVSMFFVLSYRVTKEQELSGYVNSRWANIAENANIGRWRLFLSGENKNKLWWSDNMYGIYGVEKSESFIDKVHVDDRGWVNKTVENCLRTNGAYHAVFKTSSMPVRYVRAYGHVTKDGSEFSGICVEASEREYSGSAEIVILESENVHTSF